MLTIIIQITLIWIALYLVYSLLLHKETFFNTNRLFLLSSLMTGIIVPTIVPMLNPTTPLPPVGTYISDFSAVIIPAAIDQSSSSWFSSPTNILSFIYFLGAVFMFLKLISGLIYLLNLYTKSEINNRDGYTLVITDGKHLPFSFFNLVFVNKQSINQQYIHEIIHHEIIHIKQKHSFDIIFVEILHIIFWFNPILIWYKSALRASHEYMADRALTRTISKDKYSLLLLGYTSAGDEVAFVNPFFNSLIKKRIQMMYSKNSKKSALIKYFVALPLVSVMVMAFSTYKINGQTVLAAATNELVESTERLIDLAPISSVAKANLGHVAQNENLKTHLTPINRTLNDSLPNDILYVLDGETQKSNPDIKPDEIASINVIKGEAAIAKYGLKAKNGAIEIITKSKQSLLITTPDVQARFPGNTPEESQQKFYEYLASNIKYPQSARKYGVEGKVVLKFFIDKKGDILDVEVVKGISPDCDAEAKRVIEDMVSSQGKWIPATKDGQAVLSKMHLPIKFMLSPLNAANKIQVENLTVSYYPNPATDYIMIDVKGELNIPANIQLLNPNGQVVKQITTQEQGLKEMNTADLTSGEYVLHITNGKIVKTEKVLIVR